MGLKIRRKNLSPRFRVLSTLIFLLASLGALIYSQRKYGRAK